MKLIFHGKAPWALVFLLALSACGKANFGTMTQANPSYAVPLIMSEMAAPSSRSYPWQNLFKLPTKEKALVLGEKSTASGVKTHGRPLCELINLVGPLVPELLRLDETLCVLKTIREYLGKDSRGQKDRSFLLHSFPNSTFSSRGKIKEGPAGEITQLLFEACQNEVPAYILSYQAGGPAVRILSTSLLNASDNGNKRQSFLDVQGKLNRQSEWLSKQVKAWLSFQNKKINYQLDSTIHQFPSFFSVSGTLQGHRQFEIGEETFERSLYSVVRGEFRAKGLQLGEGTTKVRIGRSFVDSKGEVPFFQEWVDSWEDGTYRSLSNPESGEYYQRAMDGPFPMPPDRMNQLPEMQWDCHSAGEGEAQITADDNGDRGLGLALKSCLSPSGPRQTDWSDCRISK